MKPNMRFNLFFLDKGIRESFDYEDGKIFHTNYTKHIKKDNFNVYDDERPLEDLIDEDEFIIRLEKSCPLYGVDTYL